MNYNQISTSLAIGCVLAILAPIAIFWVAPQLKVMVGYSAQIACLQHFVARRPIDFISHHELSAWNNAPFEIHDNEVVSTLPFIALYHATSHFTPDIGCVLEGEIEGAYQPIAPQPMRRRLNQRVQNIARAYIDDKALHSRALLVAHKGVIIAEAYGDDTKPNQPHQGWSLTKSLLHALYGVAIKNGVINVNQPPPVRYWRETNDGRFQISYDDLFRMSSGLVFDETYWPPSDVTQMLFTKQDVGDFAALKFMKLAMEKEWSYSSGTTNILSWIYKKTLLKQKRDPIAYMRQSLFQPLGMATMTISPDWTGTPIASSFGFASAEDWLKLGQLYLQKGRWNNKQLIAPEWTKQAASLTKGSGGRYGHHWWVNAPIAPKTASKAKTSQKKDNRAQADEADIYEPRFPDLPRNAFWAGGFEGQNIMVLPSQQMVVVRLGWTPDEKIKLNELISSILAILPN